MTDPSDLMATLLGQTHSASTSTSGRQPYRAFKPSEGEKRYLEFRVKSPAPSQFVPNIQLTGILSEWRMGMMIHLAYFGKMTVAIRGERLCELAQAISDWKVEWMAEFDPALHEPIKNQDEPFIRSITILTTRPEEPPSENQKH